MATRRLRSVSMVKESSTTTTPHTEPVEDAPATLTMFFAGDERAQIRR